MSRWMPAVLVVVILVACGGGGETRRFGADSDGVTASVAVGDTVELALPADPSTGLAWEIVVFDASVLRQIGDPGFVADADPSGSPGLVVFSFEVIGGGATTLDMISRRPGASDPAADTFAITLVAG